VARIRSIHPALLTDEAFMTLTVECPLAIALLIGLWMEADDAGVFEWKPLTIKARILPAVQCDVGETISELVRNSFVKSFELGGKQYGVIRNFVRFQRPKSPIDTHPFNDEMREYAGFDNGKRPAAGIGRPQNQGDSRPVTNEFGTPSENRAQMKEEGDKKEEIKILPLPTISKGREGIFAEFWGSIPKSPAASPLKAQIAFEELTSEEQHRAIDYLPAFKTVKTTNPMSPERYLRDRIFDNLAIGPRVVSSLIRVERMTPEGDAWDAHERAKGRPPPWSNGAWHFPSKWPPNAKTSVKVELSL
jgi:hypothetical protein